MKARFGVLAADAEGLAVGPLDAGEHLVERRQAVGLGLRVGRLPRDHGQVVVEALAVLVLEHDQEHVLDRGQVRARRRCEQAGDAEQEERGAPHRGGR